MLKKLLHNANTNDKITCLKDLQSNSKSEIGYIIRWCSTMKSVPVLIFTHRLTADIHGCTNTVSPENMDSYC